jgi:hypothetical protein
MHQSLSAGEKNSAAGHERRRSRATLELIGHETLRVGEAPLLDAGVRVKTPEDVASANMTLRVGAATRYRNRGKTNPNRRLPGQLRLAFPLV